MEIKINGRSVLEMEMEIKINGRSVLEMEIKKNSRVGQFWKWK